MSVTLAEPRHAPTAPPPPGREGGGLCGSSLKHTDGVAHCIRLAVHDGWHFDICMVCLEDGFDVPLYWDDDGNVC